MIDLEMGLRRAAHLMEAGGQIKVHGRHSGHIGDKFSHNSRFKVQPRNSLQREFSEGGSRFKI
jgi:hypothetical protein